MSTVTAHNLGDIVVLRCQGRLVRGSESTLLCAAVQHHGENIILDLSGVNTIDAAGVGALVSLQAAGIYLKVLNPTEPVSAVLRLTGLDSIFEICEAQSVEEFVLQHTAGQSDLAAPLKASTQPSA